MTLIDLDQAATTATRREVLEAMWPWLTGEHGNPSSTHALGRRAADALADARARIARIAGVRPAQVVFTSGGTESDNLAVIGLTLAAIARGRDRHVLVSAIEHEAVLESAAYLERWHGVEVTRIPVDADGVVDADAALAALRPGTALVSVQAANNEVGTLQPLDAVLTAARSVGALVHTDAVQYAGWYPLVDLPALDAVTISGHKLGAPKGVGALLLPTGAAIEPLIHGGGQERDRRSGTENVAGAVGLAVALERAEAERGAHPLAALEARRDAFIACVLETVPGARSTGHATRRLPCHASFVVPGIGGEPLLIALDDRGILASSGSACAAGRDEPSPVLLAMGCDPDTARTAVRFSWGASTIQESLDTAARELAESAASLRGLG
ncbi:cysteine desulfurase family protein [Microcella frigidaquae]|uniref:Cysteine desulfurase n=1 Tax=Microcella frigidaquae TaxID=424758 RepID=A0A840XKX6_9MICO|nr:cysteine desulfurase family protein [Microcella frigidaquae]MBB5616549.1 cysteine desulfurase [Microcella frigidaquae]NHN44840.1 cysteine desulfurase [Microcella frigidaquae]